MLFGRKNLAPTFLWKINTAVCAATTNTNKIVHCAWGSDWKRFSGQPLKYTGKNHCVKVIESTNFMSGTFLALFIAFLMI